MFTYSQKSIIKTINSYLYARYDSVFVDNINESLEKQKKYYTNKLIKNPTVINNKESIEISKEYFEKTKLITRPLTILTKKVAYNKYEAKVAVLYTNDIMTYDNLVNYIFLFTINKNIKNIYEFDNVEILSNSVTYIEGREIHIHNGEAVVCDDEKHYH